MFFKYELVFDSSKGFFLYDLMFIDSCEELFHHVELFVAVS